MKLNKITWLVIPREKKQLALSEAGLLPDGKSAIGWDSDAKLWYAKPGADLSKIRNWLPDTNMKVSDGDPQIEFHDALVQSGFLLDELPLMDGQRHRVATIEDKNGKKSGVYCGYMDRRPGGWFINFHRADTEKDITNWKATSVESDPIKRLHIRAGAKQAHDDALRYRERIHRDSAVNAGKLYQSLSSVDHQHPYLFRKGIYPTPELKQTRSGSLVIPFYDINGEFQTLQYITPDGDKYLYANAPKQGHFHVVGGMLNDRQNILLAEGYATARSLNMATGYPVVMTVDAGNMVHVAKIIKGKYPASDLFMMADFDHAKKNNIGLLMAEKASELTGGRVFYPVFTEEEILRGMTDFNDLHQSRGIDAIRSQLTEILPNEDSVVSERNDSEGPQLPVDIQQNQRMFVPDGEHAGSHDYGDYELYAGSFTQPTSVMQGEAASVGIEAGSEPDSETIPVPELSLPPMFATDDERPDFLEAESLLHYVPFAGNRDKEESKAPELNAIWVGGPRPGNTAIEPESENINCDELISRLSHEIQPDKSVLYKLDGSNAFIDFGDRLEMAAGANSDDEKILAALLTAAQYYRGRIELTGSDEFKKQAISLIARHGLDVEMKVPEQQTMLNKARYVGEAGPSLANGIAGDYQEFNSPDTGQYKSIRQDGTLTSETTADISAEKINHNKAEQNSGPVFTDVPVQVSETQPALQSEAISAPNDIAQMGDTVDNHDPAIHQSALAAKTGLTGKIMDYGTAPFKFDEENDDSFYIKLRTKKGMQTFWGKELAGVLRDTRAQKGSMITLTWKGKENVTVNIPVKSNDGHVIRYESKQAHRNQWALSLKQSERVMSGTNEGVSLHVFDANRFAQRQAIILGHLNLPVVPVNVPEDGLLWLNPNGQGSQDKGDALSAIRPEQATMTALPLISRTDDKGEIDLYLVKSDGDFLQGIAKYNGEYHHVLVSLPGQKGMPPMIFNTVTETGVNPVGCGNGINKSNGTPVVRQHIAFKLEGDSKPRVAKLDSPDSVPPQLHARLGFDARYISEEQHPKAMPAAAPIVQPNEPRPV